MPVMTVHKPLFRLLLALTVLFLTVSAKLFEEKLTAVTKTEAVRRGDFDEYKADAA